MIGERRDIAEFQAKSDFNNVDYRIAQVLCEGTFALEPEMLQEVHRFLFEGIADADSYYPGEFKAERKAKRENILNGDSVLYADPFTYPLALRSAFAAERVKTYSALEGEELASFCHFIATLWHIHPFAEGNTRTIAVFSELYLRSLGFEVSNQFFAEHAKTFRDALVRAIYHNPEAGIYPDESLLVAFYEMVLGRSESLFAQEDLLCIPLFENPQLVKNID